MLGTKWDAGVPRVLVGKACLQLHVASHVCLPQLSVCHCVVSSLLARVPAVLSDGSLVSCALFYAFDMCGSESFAELWSMLPRRFRTEYGCAGGVVPSSNVLAFLVDSADDMASLVAQYVPGEAHLGHVARALWTAVQCEATAACKRRSLVDPAWQRVLLARRVPHSEATAPALCDTLSWLRSKSGACRRSGKLLLRSSKQLTAVSRGYRQAEAPSLET